MALSNKGKRTVTVDQVTFFWWIEDDGGYAELGSSKTLQIVAGKKDLAVAYPLYQSAEHNLIVLQELIVNEQRLVDDIYRYVECPAWEMNKPITSAIVRKVIKWCKNQQTFVDLDYLGNLAQREPKKPKLRLVVSN